MRSQWKRLMWAALLSCTGFGATFTWYNLSKSKTHRNVNDKPLAFIGKAVDEIQRRPATRLLWQEVGTGEPLFNGEAIRTSEKGEVRIQFADSDRYLDLEPESLIVIQQSKGEIALDLMEGSLFVAAAKEGSGTGNTSLVLNSASGKVDLSKASASLSKSGGNQVDVQVLEGSASIKGKDGKDNVINSGNSGALGANGLQFNKADLQILSPTIGKVIYVDPDEKENLIFKWKGFPPNLKVSLYTGSSRKDLKEWSQITSMDSTSLKTSLPLGKPYWKLVAKNEETQKIMAESSIYRADIQPRFAPTVLFPLADAKIPAPKAPFDMAFKWQAGNETSRIVLEVAKDPALKQKIATKNFTTEETFTLPALSEGEYFWRMSSYYEGSEKPATGKIQKFTITKAEEKVVPKDPVQIVWTVPEDKIQFYLENPKLGLSWNGTRLEDISIWRLKYFEESEDSSKAQSMELKENKQEIAVQKPGRYIASIEAIDKEGKVIGSSSPRKIAVAPLPLLPPPKLLPLDGGNLMAAADGRTDLSWEKIDGAKEYMLTISNKEGKELKTLKYTNNQTALKNLMPGEYQVKLIAIDQHGRQSEAGSARTLVVPNKSNLKAPTLKKIKVN
ncbi:MAG: FecR domain-containing protein [Bdellovibrionaceae bacterium]|nr:FecR domain-containing protein [Pseudobdellovibrionaceae bacterium]